jgi:hypothetical protein
MKGAVRHSPPTPIVAPALLVALILSAWASCLWGVSSAEAAMACCTSANHTCGAHREASDCCRRGANPPELVGTPAAKVAGAALGGIVLARGPLSEPPLSRPNLGDARGVDRVGWTAAHTPPYLRHRTLRI